MTVTLNLTPEMERRLRERAARHGQDERTFLQQLVEQQLIADESDPAYLLSLPKEQRDKILEVQAALAAPIYEADLALPVEQRELTAFTAQE